MTEVNLNNCPLTERNGRKEFMYPTPKMNGRKRFMQPTPKFYNKGCVNIDVINQGILVNMYKFLDIFEGCL